MKRKQYYIENKERGPVGNCLLWWCIDGKGYHCDIRNAQKFSFKEAREICKGRKKYKMWEVGFIDARTRPHVDAQALYKETL